MIEADRRVLEKSCHKLLKLLDSQNEIIRKDYETKRSEIDQQIESLKSFLKNDEIITAKEFIDL